MKFKIIGLENFKSKSGKEITKIHSIYKNDISDRLSGTGVESFFIMTEKLPPDTAIDVYFIPLFGRQGDKGFLEGLNIIE